jgi:hypothetical protein
MVKFGPKLEKRQVLLGRLADIGTDLFAIAAACIFAQKQINDGEAADKVFMLVDDFTRRRCCRCGGLR